MSPDLNPIEHQQFREVIMEECYYNFIILNIIITIYSGFLLMFSASLVAILFSSPHIASDTFV